MPGDAKTHSRKRKENDQVERFTESRLALQRAMEKDYLTTRESKRSVEDDHASEGRGQEKDANAERLAALLEAARQQEKAVAVGTGDTSSAKQAPAIDREHARPASFLTEDIRAARVRATHPATAPTSEADTMTPPPMVTRDAGVSTDSAGRLVVRLLIVAFVVGLAGYVFVLQRTGTGTETETEAVSATEQPLIAPATISASQPSSDVPATDDPAAPAAASAAPTGARAAAPSGDAAQASSASMPETAAPAETSSASAGSADAADTPAKPMTAAGDRPEATTATAEPASGLSVTATESAVRQVVVLPPPPPPPPSPLELPSQNSAPASGAVAEPSGAKQSIGEETLRALSLIEVDAKSIDGAATESAPPTDVKVSADGPPPGIAATGEAARAEPPSAAERAVDRRPYFRRLGPTPGPNPFRPDNVDPPAAPARSPFFTYPFTDLE